MLCLRNCFTEEQNGHVVIFQKVLLRAQTDQTYKLEDVTSVEDSLYAVICNGSGLKSRKEDCFPSNSTTGATDGS